MWKMMWITVNNFTKVVLANYLDMVQKLIPAVSTTYPQFSTTSAQGFVGQRPLYPRPYSYYLFLIEKKSKTGIH
ncbi:MAG: hypothetical protein WD970_02475 [Patescibacteria group bacterium]